ncbi:TetR/AcrR family transcriptional regulator [Nocardioides daeguensis]|uniref:TetR/AcrR family transcriptional regulator n=1 Tax=Nocardioides daeguensis TaxID=908359 RepID=A0ABP6US63_9ACTN|nr:TetR/AcrR family transcriptional regulator [Nocardioides daeguensis]MBV6725573.1 TetR/AcrR family transcriptional regulator [Nocardioides daeguensis]MCR1771433.1 TetR/AcrR family transcriptional regulator [Nocardioides daeguensis]
MARRVTPEHYFARAMQLLADDGYPALKQATLCKALGVTTGSFYNHFGNWQGFTDQLLNQWREERTLQIAEAAAQATDPVDALERLRDMACTLPYRSEAAIRAWSLTDPLVARIQAQVDRERLDTVQRAMDAMFTDPAVAEMWARSAIYLLIGFEQFETHPHNTRRLTWALNKMLEQIQAERDH